MYRRGGRRQFLYVRLALLAVVLVAALAFHASGQTLVLVRVARYAVIAVLVLGAGAFQRRRR